MNRAYVTLFASMLVTFVLGSVHGFSVFVVPLESRFMLPRSQISLIYSLALVCITLSVLFGYRIYASMTAWLLVMITCLFSALGLLVSAHADGWSTLFVGYSLMFGLSNGIGYGFTLQLVGRELPGVKGFAMGAVTAAYAVGSIVFSKIFAIQILSGSVSAAFMALAVALFAVAIIAAGLMWWSQPRYALVEGESYQSGSAVSSYKVFLFWIAYMCSVFAGLMAIGHAAGIAISSGASITLSVWSAMMIGAGSAAGGFLAGWLVDRWPVTRFLIGLPLASAVALGLISLGQSALMAIILLTVVGFAYGAIIAIYPVAISNYFGAQGPKVYGQVFTAWGFAGLVAPWLAGVIYDFQSSYSLALAVASIIALISALTVKSGRFE